MTGTRCDGRPREPVRCCWYDEDYDDLTDPSPMPSSCRELATHWSCCYSLEPTRNVCEKHKCRCPQPIEIKSPSLTWSAVRRFLESEAEMIESDVDAADTHGKGGQQAGVPRLVSTPPSVRQYLRRVAKDLRDLLATMPEDG